MLREHVLVVDDNADLRQYLAGLLSSLYDISTATDGLAALEAIRARMPNIVVSDVMMPRLDGFGLVRVLRSDSRTASLPVILLSARAGEESAIDGLDAGADDYLVKPFSARELLARVRTHAQLARFRREWIDKLERANRELDAFSYSVSHDLRAPLRAIEGYASLLAQDYAKTLDAAGQTYLDRILAGVTQMSTLIEALLELARLSRATVQRERIDLSAMANEVIGELRRANPDRNVDVKIESDLVAHGDPKLVRVALVNLLGNAWKFSSRTPSARIECGRHKSDENTFFVRDNGAGFAAEHAAKLFAPFQRLHSAKEFPGTGVGLATVQRVIEHHGGTIWADAKLGSGATFYFSLPDFPENQ